MPKFTKVGTVSELPSGTGKVVQVDGKAIALFHCDGSFYAMENECTHRGGPLGEGALAGKSVSCPWHGWSFDIISGVCEMNPAVRVVTFPVKTDGDNILVAVS